MERDPKRDRRIIAQCERQNKPLPKRIENAPELALGLELYYEAFWDLSTCRQVGLGIAPISFLNMREYAIAHEFDDEQKEDLFHYARRMDNAFIQFHSKKES